MQLPPQYSADGRFWWNGYQWVPAWQPGTPQRRSLWPYILASVFVPGLGSLLQGRWRWGAAVLGAFIACVITFFVVFAVSFASFAGSFPVCFRTLCRDPAFFQANWPGGIFITMAVVWPIGFVAWIVGIIDAARGAQEWNRAHGFPD